MPKHSAIVSILSDTPKWKAADELHYQVALQVKEFAKNAGVPFTSDMGLRATVTDLAQTGDRVRQLVELEL